MTTLTLILPLLLQAAPTVASPDPGLEAARNYAECLGSNAVWSSLAHSADYAIDGAFETCRSQRQVAVAAIAERFRVMGVNVNARRARTEAEDFLHNSDRTMAAKMRADIAAYKRTGQVPNNAEN